MPAPDRAGYARHHRLRAAAVEGGAGIHEVDAFERGGEAVRVAFAPHLAVRDDVDARLLHVADREPRGVVLRFLEVLLGDAPDLGSAYPRHLGAEFCAVDEPIGLRIAADHGGGKEMHRRRWYTARAPDLLR